MANAKNVHVVPRGEKWAVIREGNSRASSLHGTQNHAWQTGQGMARSDKGEAFLHGQNGQIRQRNTTLMVTILFHPETRNSGRSEQAI